MDSSVTVNVQCKYNHKYIIVYIDPSIVSILLINDLILIFHQIMSNETNKNISINAQSDYSILNIRSLVYTENIIGRSSSVNVTVEFVETILFLYSLANVHTF